MTTIVPTSLATDAPGYSSVLPGSATSARSARLLVRVALNAWGLTAMAAESELIASELAANAAVHSGCRPMHVRVTRTAPGRIHIAVTDASSTAPRSRRLRCDAETGRGLLLVEALADRWGTDLHRRKGKTVWAELLLAQGAER